MREIKKPWGKETILELNDHYCVKILEIEAGKRLSLQYHERKRESVYVLDGVLADLDSYHRPNTIANFPPRTVHRFEAIDGPVKLLEISTPELDDVKRIEDDYGRVNAIVHRDPGPTNHPNAAAGEET